MLEGKAIPARNAPGLDSTVTSQDLEHVNKTQRQCRVQARGADGYSVEVHSLLKQRLRVVSLITTVACASFFLKTLAFPDTTIVPTMQLTLQAVLLAILVALSALLWTRAPFCIYGLRTVETILFGSMAAYFAYLHYSMYHHGHYLAGVSSDQANTVTTLANLATSLRWFALIVLYGTFIPNTWKRCALIVGLIAAIPLVLIVLDCGLCPVMSTRALSIFLDMALVLGLGAAIAIFGSYKIHTLEQQAFHARQLGQYRLLQKIGSGGMGDVYLAEHMLLRRACAIKLIRPDQAGNAITLSRFEREVQAMANLTHWNTVEVYDYGRADDGTFYYVMEYLPGLSLQQLVEKHGPLPPARAVHFLRQICAALREAHGIGLIHRDVKPSNVLVCQRGVVRDVAKLLDFGLVQDVNLRQKADKLTLHGAILGSPGYISPEQARGKNDIDGRTDIYSVGGLAHFLLTGHMPFERDTIMELIAAHLNEKPTSPRSLQPELPRDLEEVILRCLQKDPAKRFATIADLDAAFSHCDAAEGWSEHHANQWWRDVATETRLVAAGDRR